MSDLIKSEIAEAEKAVDSLFKDMGLEIFRLYHRADRKKEPTRRPFRRMTTEEAKRLKPRDQVCIRDGQHRWVYATVNGKPIWKKSDPNAVEVPIKYGLYETFHDTTIANVNGTWMNLLLIEVPV